MTAMLWDQSAGLAAHRRLEAGRVKRLEVKPGPPVKPYLCRSCGTTTEGLFRPDMKSECLSCYNIRRRSVKYQAAAIVKRGRTK